MLTLRYILLILLILSNIFYITLRFEVDTHIVIIGNVMLISSSASFDTILYICFNRARTALSFEADMQTSHAIPWT